MTEKSIEEIMDDIEKENAEAAGVSIEEIRNMYISEIEAKLREEKRKEYVKNRIFGSLRLRFRDWYHTRLDSHNSIIFGNNIYE